MENDLKILVVDDTVTERQLLSKIVSGIRDVELVGTAPNGKIAAAKIKLKHPDLVLLDVVMPEMDGIQTLEWIKKEYPYIDVIVLSGMDHENANITMAALSAGALDFIPKPRGPSAERNIAELTSALSRLISMARTRKYSRQARGLAGNRIQPKPSMIKPPPPDPSITPRVPDLVKVPAVPPSQEEKTSPPVYIRKPLEALERKRESIRRTGRIDVVGIGVSTGGPNALQEVIPKIAGDFPVPILIVQHMPPMFTASLAARLDSLSAIRVVEGQEGAPVEKGVIYIAPGGRHMVARKDDSGRKCIGLLDTPPVNSCRPSVDVLFRSMALLYGGNILTVILTGMGCDGVAGVGTIIRKGGLSIVQDEKTSVIWGMPGSVAASDLADEIVPIDMMAQRMMSIVRDGHL